MTFAILAVLLTLGLFGLQLYSLKWGLSRAKLANISSIKAFLYFLLFAIVASLVGAIVELALPAIVRPPSEVESILIATVLQSIVAAIYFFRVYRAKLMTAVRAAFPFFVVTAVPMLFTNLVVRPFVYDSFYVPTNSMAPTLLGEHLTGKCPRCGHDAYGFAPTRNGGPTNVDQPMICCHELKSCVVQNPPKNVESGDRFMVSKLTSPRRWDIAVFKLPADPSINYAKRIVGLPGETVVIRDGEILINGKVVDPPEAIRGIEYLSTIPGAPEVTWGTDEHPARLADDEYFVLGDFSAQAHDSRFWQVSGSARPPYAVPADHIIGVATHIFWPISRWRTFDWGNR